MKSTLDSGQNQGESKNLGKACSNIRELCLQGRLQEVVHMLYQMDHRGLQALSDDYVLILQQCISRQALAEAKRVYALCLKSGFEPDLFLGTRIVKMYAECGRLIDARHVFDIMPERDVVSWSVMIAGYAQHGFGVDSLKLFEQMQQQGVNPDKVVYVSALKSCASLAATEKGRHIHACIIESGIETDNFVWNTFVDMYAKCGSIEQAQHEFMKMPRRNVVSWNTMIAGYVHDGFWQEALKLFEQMQEKGVKPDKFTLTSVLNACACGDCFDQGKRIHALIFSTSEFESDVRIGNAVVDMYAKCGDLEHAYQVFQEMPVRNVVSWTSLITGYAKHELGKEALQFYKQMQREGVKPDKVTFISAVNACASIPSLQEGKLVHRDFVESGFELDLSVGNSLIDMYAKCSSLEHACIVFNTLSAPNVCSWTTMISGYAQHGLFEKSLELFWHMLHERVNLDRVTFVSALNACAGMASLEQGTQIHAHIIYSGAELDVFVGSALVDMYAKCGSLLHACQVFDKIPVRNIVSWTAIVSAHAQHGNGKAVSQLIQQMHGEGVKIDTMASVCVLSACSHTGLVEEGRRFFDSMIEDYGIKPTVEHYACMVDLLGRAGHLAEAVDLIHKMPFQPTRIVWTALLGACRTFGNMEIAKQATEGLLRLESQDASTYVLLSNISSASRTSEQESSDNDIRCVSVKDPGYMGDPSTSVEVQQVQ